MARPQRVGLDYFPLDTDIEQDDKIALIEAKYGIVGFGIIVKLFKKIYRNKGYYYNWDERTQLLFAGQTGVGFDEIGKILKDAIEWGVFNKKKFSLYKILTSKRIQDTYFAATVRRKEVVFTKEFIINGVKDYINRVNTHINAVNDIQEYTKESKEKEKKDNKKIYVAVIDYLNKKTEKKFKATKGNIKWIEARLNEGHTFEDFKKVIDIKTSQWKNDKVNNKYLRPETLFGNKFDGYLNEEVTPRGTDKIAGVEAYKEYKFETIDSKMPKGYKDSEQYKRIKKL